jgi:AcrR family transcriptional regulator
LARSFVVDNQRERILAAVVEVASASGYQGLTVGAVIAQAGVSRRTFYELFQDKQDVFLAAYDRVVSRLAAEVAKATGEGQRWAEQISHGLDTFLTRLAGDPALAHLCIVEILAAGPEGLNRRALALESFRAFLEPGPRHAPEQLPIPTLAAETAIGGIYEVIYTQVLNHQTQHLPNLLPDLLQITLLPFLGAQTAAEEANRVRRKHRRTKTAAR